MTIRLIFAGTGMTQEWDEQVLAQICPGNQLPPGMHFHAAGVGVHDDIVIDIWESPESVEAQESEQLRQAANVTS